MLEKPLALAVSFLTTLLLLGVFADWLVPDLGALGGALRGGWAMSADSTASLTAFQRWLLATRETLVLVATSVVLTLPLGTCLGGLGVLFPRSFGVVLSRAVALAGALPSLVLLGLWMLHGSSRSLLGFAAAIALLRGTETARLVAEQGRRAMHQDYALAARALGGNRLHVFRWHVWPQLWNVLALEASATATYAMGLDAALGFVGLATASQSTWGALLRSLPTHPDAVAWAALCSVVLTGLSLGALAARPAGLAR